MKDNKVFAILKKTSLMKLKNSKVELAAIDDLDSAIDKSEIYKSYFNKRSYCRLRRDNRLV